MNSRILTGKSLSVGSIVTSEATLAIESDSKLVKTVQIELPMIIILYERNSMFSYTIGISIIVCIILCLCETNNDCCLVSNFHAIIDFINIDLLFNLSRTYI